MEIELKDIYLIERDGIEILCIECEDGTIIEIENPKKFVISIVI